MPDLRLLVEVFGKIKEPRLLTRYGINLFVCEQMLSLCCLFAFCYIVIVFWVKGRSSGFEVRYKK